MLHRSVAFIVAVFMLCSGLLLPDPALGTAAATAWSADEPAGSSTPQQCSVAGPDQYDRPDELADAVQADMLQDATALITAAPGMPASAMTLAPPRQWASAGHRPPFLEAPQRPPCTTDLPHA